ncbi:MAG TPA: FAD-dependent oxidoreductase [Fimbriimonadaceae bacterium]|nr:FAD-dependent oxidoreductase [Fimbriimonadaceae bacterium]
MNQKAEGAVLGFEEIHPPLSAEQAAIEAERCLQCGGALAPAPCIAACPSVIDIPRFIREIRDGTPLEAAQTIFASNALGGSCARVCPTLELCEGACVMTKEGRRPVEIGRLQRYATDAALGTLGTRRRTKPTTHNGMSVGVIGAGPAGLACAEELACLGYEVTVYEKRALPGGLVTYGIAPYKQRIDPVFEEAERIATLGIRMRFGIEVGKDVPIEELFFKHQAVFLGIGMGPDQRANLPGEDLPGIFESLPLIQEIKLGKPEKLGLTNKRVAVIGGGNTAVDVGRELVRIGVREVTLVYRRDEDSMPAYRHEIEAAKAEGVKFQFLTAPIRFVGKSSVNGIECTQMQLSAPDASGRPKPVPIPGMEFVFECDAVVKAIGQSPLQHMLDALEVRSDRGRALVSETFQSSNPKVFAGGDVINGGTTAVESVRHGKLAARGIDAYLAGHPFEAPEPRRIGESSVKHDGPFLKTYQGDHYVGTSTTLCKGCNLCVNSCPADILFLDGKSKIGITDVAQCVFCGICEMRCPDFAIWIVKDESKPHPIEVEARRRLTL